MATKLRAASPVAQRSSHSVTDDLEAVFEGAEFTERLYRFIREKLDELVRRRLGKSSLRLADVDDIQQRTALRASRAIKKKRYNSRESFTYLCIAIIQTVLPDWYRYELQLKRRPPGKRIPEDLLARMADDRGFQPGEREIAQELTRLSDRLLDEEPPKKQEVLSKWMYEVGLMETQNPKGGSAGKTPPCSNRTRLRWIEEFRGKIYNAWLASFEKRRTQLVKLDVEVPAGTTYSKKPSGRRKGVRPR